MDVVLMDVGSHNPQKLGLCTNLWMKTWKSVPIRDPYQQVNIYLESFTF